MSKVPDAFILSEPSIIYQEVCGTLARRVVADLAVYAIDAIYLKVALDNHSVLVSLDKEDLTDKVNSKEPNIEAYHVSDFPY